MVDGLTIRLNEVRLSYVSCAGEMLENSHQEFFSSIIPCLERHLSPENAIEMWLTCHEWRESRVRHHHDENQELEDFLHLCEEFIAVNYQRIPMSQEMRKRHETYNSHLLHLVPEVHRQAMVALYNQNEGQDNLTGMALGQPIKLLLVRLKEKKSIWV